MAKENVVTGVIELRDDDWTWTPDSLKKGDARQLAVDLRFIKRVNPASGVTFMRHLPKASGCAEHLGNPDKHAKCVINMNNL